MSRIADATRENILYNYFEAFSNKDIDTLKGMFSSDITLKDSHVNCNGLKEVITANEMIFKSCLRITAMVDNIIIQDNSAAAVITIEVITQGSDPLNDYAENFQELKVVDVFEFNDLLEIVSISAYKQ